MIDTKLTNAQKQGDGIEGAVAASTHTNADHPASTSNSPIERWRIPRSDDKPLRFSGIILGESTEESEACGYYHRTSIYAASNGDYIATIVTDNDRMCRPFRRAETFKEPDAMIAWLRNEEGTLDSTTVDALDKAATIDPKVDRAFGQDVD